MWSWREPFRLVTFVCELQMFNRPLSGDGVLGDLGYFWIPRQFLQSVPVPWSQAPWRSWSGLPGSLLSVQKLVSLVFSARLPTRFSYSREVCFVATSPYQIHQNPTFYTSWGSLSFFLLKMNNKILRFHPNGVSRRCLAFYSYLDDRRRHMKPSQN